MAKLKNDEGQYILIEKEQYLDLIRDVENLKQKVNTCEGLIISQVRITDKLIETIEILTEKTWGKK